MPAATTSTLLRAEQAPAQQAHHGRAKELGPSRKRAYHPRRFDGCVQCKKYKVKCSREKPACARCQRAHSECVYAAPNVWMVETAQSVSATGRERKTISSPTGSSSKSSSASTSASNSPPDGSLDLVATRSLHATGAQQQLWGILYESMCPVEFQRFRLDEIAWIERVISHPNKGPALTQMVNALALKRHAFLSADAELDLAGSAAYTEALGSIQRRLGNARLVHTDETLSAVKAAFFYEQLFPSDGGRSLRAHWRGLQQLVETDEPAGGWGALGVATLRSVLFPQFMSLFTDARKGPTPALLVKSLLCLDPSDEFDAFKTDRSTDMQVLIQLGEQIREAQRNIAAGGLQMDHGRVDQLGHLIVQCERSLFEWIIPRANMLMGIDPAMISAITRPDPVHGFPTPYGEWDGSDIPMRPDIGMSQSYGEWDGMVPNFYAYMKILNYCFFKLYLIDLAVSFQEATGVFFAVPGMVKLLDPGVRIALSLNIVRSQMANLGGPKSILLTMASGYPICLAHKTLLRTAPSLAHESEAVIQRCVEAGNGFLPYGAQLAMRGNFSLFF